MNPEYETDNTTSADETEALEVTAAPETMEPPVFVVQTVLDAGAQLEASRAAMPKMARLLAYVCFGLSALMLGVLIWQFAVTGNSINLIMAGLLALVLVYLLYTQFSAPKKALIRWEEGIRKSFGTDRLHLTTEFFGRTLAQSIAENDDVLVEGYSAISEMRETEHLLLLRCGKRQWFFLAKDGFTTGTVEDFRSFIAEHLGGK